MRFIIILLLCSSSILGQSNIFDLISESEDHQILTSLLEVSGFDDLLKNETYYSLLAPDDEAFRSVYSDEGIDTLKMNIDNALINLIEFHLIKEDTLEIDGISSAESLLGKEILTFIDGAGNVIIAGGAAPRPYLKYEDPIIFADNGRAYHLVDGIINVPYTPFLDLLFASPFFIDAISKLNYVDSFFQTENYYTAFIPPEEEILSSELYLSGALENLDTLESFLTRHIIPGYYKINDFYDGQTLEDFAGNLVNIQVIEDSIYVHNSTIIKQCPNTTANIILIKTFINTEPTTSVNEKEDYDFKIYPNPSRDFVFISNPNLNNGFAINVMSKDGRIIQQFNVRDNIYKLNTSDKAPGIYYIQCIIDSGKYSMYPIVVD